MARKTSFYYAFLALPSEKRHALLAVFDFCRAVDDSVDLADNPHSARAAVDEWRAEVAAMFERRALRTSEARALQPAIERFQLGKEHFDALIDGVEMDIAPREYRTFAELEQYCHRVASAVGLMSVPIFGYADPSVPAYARDLGVALQLTNILRDVGVDYRRGRVYVPTEDLERFACSRDDIRREVEHAGRGLQSERLRLVLDHQAARARVFFGRASRALPSADARALVPAEIMRAIYAELLRRIEQARCDVFSVVHRVPRPVQARLAIATWWSIRNKASRS